jgi:hypothetical protein
MNFDDSFFGSTSSQKVVFKLGYRTHLRELPASGSPVTRERITENNYKEKGMIDPKLLAPHAPVPLGDFLS